MRRKICVITGSRAEYGLLYWLLKEIKKDPELELNILVTGMHLSPEFGLTYKVIEKDGFKIDSKVETLLSSDTPTGISKSLALGVSGISEAFERLTPDIAVVLGDRFEMFAAAVAASIARIPMAHIHGGETTQGAIDEAFRHSMTKMSHLHFVSTDQYRNRVVQLGEDPDKVFTVGAVGVENIHRLDLLSKNVLEKEIGFSLNDNTLMVTFHPVTLEHDTAAEQFNHLLNAIDSRKDLRVIFTKCNADTHGRVINEMIDAYVSKHKENCISFTSMGQLRYLSSLQYVKAVVGNSSSGIIEVPSFRKPTINIGDRQKGRLIPETVISCGPTAFEIEIAFEKAFSDDFLQRIKQVESPYEKEHTAATIKEILKESNFEGLLKKEFYDIPV